MKKLLLVLILLASISIHAQKNEIYHTHDNEIIVRVGIDPKMAFQGAYEHDTTPVLDMPISATYRWNLFEVGFEYEYAGIDYNHFVALVQMTGPIYDKEMRSTHEYGWDLPIDRIEFFFGLDAGKIVRDFGTFDTYAQRMGLRFLKNRIGLEFWGTRRHRFDIDKLIYSGYISMIVKIN